MVPTSVNIKINSLFFSCLIFSSSPIPMSKILGDASFEGENEFLFFFWEKCDKRNKNVFSGNGELLSLTSSIPTHRKMTNEVQTVSHKY